MSKRLVSSACRIHSREKRQREIESIAIKVADDWQEITQDRELWRILKSEAKTYFDFLHQTIQVSKCFAVFVLTLSSSEHKMIKSWVYRY